MNSIIVINNQIFGNLIGENAIKIWFFLKKFVLFLTIKYSIWFLFATYVYFVFWALEFAGVH